MSMNSDCHDDSNVGSPHGQRTRRWAANQSANPSNPPPPAPSAPPSYHNAMPAAPPPPSYRAATLEERQRAVTKYIELTNVRNTELAVAVGLCHPTGRNTRQVTDEIPPTDNGTGRDETDQSLRLGNQSDRSERSDVLRQGSLTSPPSRQPVPLPSPSIVGLAYRNIALLKYNTGLERENRRLRAGMAALRAENARFQAEMRRRMQQLQTTREERAELNAPLQDPARRIATVQGRATAREQSENRQTWSEFVCPENLQR